MSPDEFGRLVAQYRAGVEAELHLLHQLAGVSDRQRTLSEAGDYTQFAAAADERDGLTRSLVTLEASLREARHALSAEPARAQADAAFASVEAMHRDAARLVASILAADEQSLSAMANAELARRTAVASLERGETTLAAYRRVLAPPVAPASLVDQLG
jgi:hypothetical protein